MPTSQPTQAEIREHLSEQLDWRFAERNDTAVAQALYAGRAVDAAFVGRFIQQPLKWSQCHFAGRGCGQDGALQLGRIYLDRVRCLRLLIWQCNWLRPCQPFHHALGEAVQGRA